MTFFKNKQIIEQGDVVIVFAHPGCSAAITLKPKGTYSNKYGVFSHDSMINLPYGSKLASNSKNGFIYLLHPTPELWTSVLPHRTQIVYMTDISFVSTMLNLEPGVKMLECGTGSGSFSHSAARTIMPTGHLYSFEYHEDRGTKASLEFNAHGLDMITVECRDVCKVGFGLKSQVSAAFLDLPSPWEALEHLPECFDVDMIGRVCCFSPCIEQVIKTVEKMSELGFYDIEMFEVLVKTFDMKKIATNKWGKEEIQVKDRTVHHSKNDSLKEDESKCQSEDIVDNTTMTEVEINTSSIGRKRAAEEDIIKKDKPTNIDESSREMPTTCSTSVRTSIEKVNVDENGDFILVTRPGITTRGHTSFLTFAKYLAKKIEMPIISSEPIIRSIVDEAAVSVEDSANK